MQRLDTAALTALVGAYSLGPLATQIITPAVPFVHQDLGVGMASAQALVSLAFTAIAVATLIYGPLADRFGRRPVILLGTALYCAGSLLAALSLTADWLLLGRVVQSAGSAAGLSLARTVIHDVYGPQRSDRALAQLTTVMIFVPMLAPGVGGTLIDHVGWRAVFGVCLVSGLAALALIAFHMPETRPPQARRPRMRDVVHGYVAVLREHDYRAPAFHFSWVMAALFATQAAIPYLVVEVLGGSATEYGVWFGVACLFYVAGNQFTARWGQRFERRRLILASGVGCAVAAASGAIAIQFFPMNTVVLFVPTIVLYFFAAVGIAPVQAEAVAAQPARAGAASGLLTSLQMVIGAATVQAIGFAHDGTPRPLFVGLVVCSVAALAAFVQAGAHPQAWSSGTRADA